MELLMLGWMEVLVAAMEEFLTFKLEVLFACDAEKRLETTEAAAEHTVRIPEKIFKTAGKVQPGGMDWEDNTVELTPSIGVVEFEMGAAPKGKEWSVGFGIAETLTGAGLDADAV
jgi:hypothetical protein